jgi:hypothetical protein
MPTKVALAALAVTTMALAGCQSTDSTPAPAVAAPVTSASGAPAAAAGNGVAALTGDQILAKAKAAVKKTKSLRAKGTVVEDGEKTDIDLKVDGSEFAATMTIGKAKVQLLAVGGKKYFRPNEAFWVLSTDAKQGKSLAKAVGTRWIAGADDDESFASLFSIGDVNELLKPTGAVSTGEAKVVRGIPAIGLKDAGDPDSALYVATTGEPYPLQLTGKDGSTLAFDNFGGSFTDIKKPAASQIVDLGKLGG